MDERTAALVAECRRQEESCLYTSTTLYEWLKSLRWWRVGFVVLPIVLSAVATWKLLEKQAGYEWITGTCALLAGMVPAVYKALRFDVSLDTLEKSASQFKTLQDRFRQAARITALSSLDQLEADFAKLMEQLGTARATSLAPPERFFRRAQKKIDAGDYDFSIDAKETSRGS
ncbi:MAG TPA: hypothetical protein VIY90_14565 [Steroidobacteraceae bacterium]